MRAFYSYSKAPYLFLPVVFIHSALSAGTYKQELSKSNFFEIGRKAAIKVDSVAMPHVPNERKLLKSRAYTQSHIDTQSLLPSIWPIESGKSFFAAIRHAVHSSVPPKKIYSNPSIDRAYGLPPYEQKLPVSLVTHPLCKTQPEDAAQLLGHDYVPNQIALNQLNTFAALSNHHRRGALSRSHLRHPARAKFELLWATLFSCLAYKESLSDLEASPELNENYRTYLNDFPETRAYLESQGMGKRSPGVHFGVDRPGEYYIRRRAIMASNIPTEERTRLLAELDAEYSRWGTGRWIVSGMYQFSPTLSTNALPCIDQWNKEFPNAAIQKTLPGITEALVSPAQSFNSYCGVQKVVQGFSSQINTVNRTGVHSANWLQNSRIADPEDRCVSLLMRGGTGRIYTHFGPLRNSTGNNFAALMSCVEKSMLPELQY